MFVVDYFYLFGTNQTSTTNQSGFEYKKYHKGMLEIYLSEESFSICENLHSTSQKIYDRPFYDIYVMYTVKIFAFATQCSMEPLRTGSRETKVLTDVIINVDH